MRSAWESPADHSGDNGLGPQEALLERPRGRLERVVSVHELVPVIVSLDDRPSS
jgi:hypothetical protein